jgi:hypothetical protein
MFPHVPTPQRARSCRAGNAGAVCFLAVRSSPGVTGGDPVAQYHEVTLPAGDGTLPFLGLRSLGPIAVSAAPMPLFCRSGSTSGAGNATFQQCPAITWA